MHKKSLAGFSQELPTDVLQAGERARKEDARPTQHAELPRSPITFAKLGAPSLSRFPFRLWPAVLLLVEEQTRALRERAKVPSFVRLLSFLYSTRRALASARVTEPDAEIEISPAFPT